MMDWLILALFLAIAVTATICARVTRPDRNYWPMLRVMWMALAFAYGGSAIGLVVGNNRSPVTRTAFTLAMLAAVLYSAWFMRRRNRTPRFIRLTLGGDLLLLSVGELDHAAMLTESWAHHGAMPPERAASMRAALAEWERKRAWAADLRRQARAKREGGIPGLDD